MFVNIDKNVHILIKLKTDEEMGSGVLNAIHTN
jgi:hypothetical protein